MLRIGWVVLLVTAIPLVGSAQEAAKAVSENEGDKALLRLDGNVRGIIVGLQRATLAVLSARQIVTYFHVPLNKLPDWVRAGTDVTVQYRVSADGSFWAEHIDPYKPPTPTTPPAMTTPTVTIVPLEQTPSSAPTPLQRQGSLTELRRRTLPSRGLSALQSRLNAPLNLLENEVQRLLPHYRAAVRFFNPNLTDSQAEALASAVLRCAIRHGIDPRLVVAVIACESTFRPDAVGKRGEIGLGQLKPETAAGLGVDPYDPVQNIDGCVRYLRQQLDRFGSVELALAAYNAGPTAVQKAGGIPQNGVTPRYVQKVLELYRRLCGQ